MQSSGYQTTGMPAHEQEPWQLKMFHRSLKKQQKVRTLLEVLGPLQDQRCLLVTCGDNNGALNWMFKQHGGAWSWADAEEESTAQISALLGDPVAAMDKENPALSFPDDYFDFVMTIDVHEHLRNPQAANAELERVTKPGGTVIVTTPNGDETKLATRIKKLVGMRPADYGHFVVGYDIPDLERQLQAVGLKPYARASYSKFFTEIVELGINFLYVRVLSRRSKAKVQTGQIAPQNEDQIRSVEKSYKMYSLLYPFINAFSKLDVLAGSQRGYAVVVAARKD